MCFKVVNTNVDINPTLSIRFEESFEAECGTALEGRAMLE
jgi:hypothetical protein